MGRIPQSGDGFVNDGNQPRIARSNILGNLRLGFPLGTPAPITSRFGWRVHPILGEQRFHAGIDFGAASGTPVLAAAAGYIQTAEEMGGYGLAIVIEHLDGSFQTLYGHLSESFVQPGMGVQAGQLIGKVGSTGLSTGPHLHFEVRQRQGDDWIAIDPLPKLPSSGETQSTAQALFKQRQFVEERAWVQRMTVER
ncbi:M23 family metallopeptidase [Alkalinema pantanalense CENA528]|uniref:M23 family metallopeptidase n=1 Tax=Alkalinema pantanalense TaxID=1620705 RepID=UPI003D6E7DE9